MKCFLSKVHWVLPSHTLSLPTLHSSEDLYSAFNESCNCCLCLFQTHGLYVFLQMPLVLRYSWKSCSGFAMIIRLEDTY